LSPDADVRVDDLDVSPSGSRFDLVVGGRRLGRVELAVPGAFNAINAAGALGLGLAVGLSFADMARGLAAFSGARRRFELEGVAGGVRVFDDYAHHPTEVAATIAAGRTLAPKRLIVVFQPHLYSRTRALAREFGRALAGADVTVVLAVYPARERAEDFPGVDGHLVAAATADAAGGRTVAWLPAFEDARAFLAATLREGDLCVLMGAGDVDRLGRSLVA
jgi:UDP-N-acetylmuramate--alanine ligase